MEYQFARQGRTWLVRGYGKTGDFVAVRKKDGSYETVMLTHYVGKGLWVFSSKQYVAPTRVDEVAANAAKLWSTAVGEQP